MNPKLTSVHSNGKPVLNEKTVYILENPSLLEQLASQSLDNNEEETFSEEVMVVSKDDQSTHREIYCATFTRHASWGLKGEIETVKHGKFALWLEFCRDAE